MIEFDQVITYPFRGRVRGGWEGKDHGDGDAVGKIVDLL